ncbi:MAG: DUF3160 domain-containing protein [Candidatus Thorarchaeota archaeon]|nr:DUF3160 domain-containing protein [Candidatus Thorarchaeota archaeon]
MSVLTLEPTTKKKMITSGVISSILAATLIVGIAGYVSWFGIPTIPQIQVNGLGVQINTTISHAFADYEPYSENFTINAPQYTISPGLTNVVNLDSFPDLTTEQKQLLETNGFVAVPQSDYKQIYDILIENEGNGLPSFVTSDAVLHAFHVLYDLSLREAEVYSFWDLLGNVTTMMLDSSIDQYHAAPPGRWQDAALRNVIYFSVAAYLLDNTTSILPEAQTEVNKVLSLIDQHSQMTDDWFMEYKEDFTQYVPRGHYTRSYRLEQFFLAMMWYGRIGFRLVPKGSLSNNAKGMNETAQAILLTLALKNPVPFFGSDVDGYDLWEAIYYPTVFFVGEADDLLPTEYLKLINETYGLNPSFTTLANDTLLSKFIESAVKLRSPQILSSLLGDFENINQTMGLRFMGQRYIPDSYILSQLVYSHVENRFMPKGLDVMAALGSERAWKLLEDDKKYPNYVEQMAMLRNKMGNLTAETWTSNLYYLWLYSLLPLLEQPTQNYPLFMQNSAWVDKQLMTALASWTELRHDTILYAKQSYGRFTAIGETSQGYVEPVPKLYGRLASLCKMMLSGLEKRDLISNSMRSQLTRLHEFLLDLRAISIKELSGKALNETDLLTISASGSTLEAISTMPEDSMLVSSADKQMAVIADVHTDPNSGQVLEEAVGNPMLIYVVTSVNGQILITRGGTFSYYEFTHPASDRLTDEAWQDMLSSQSAPSMPSWTESFAVGHSASGAIVFLTRDQWNV